MIKETRTFHIEDVDCDVLIEIASSKKDIFDFIEEYVENLEFDWFDATEDSFQILYKDGTEDFVDSDYDGHKIRRQNVKSMVYSNVSSYIVFGDYEVNEYGSVYVA